MQTSKTYIIITSIIMTLLMLAISSCGRRGALYLPPAETPTVAPNNNLSQ